MFIIFFISIYKGWLPTVLKVSTAQATRFGVFQVLKSSSWYGEDSTAKSALAGATAGAASVFAFQVCAVGNRACVYTFFFSRVVLRFAAAATAAAAARGVTFPSECRRGMERGAGRISNPLYCVVVGGGGVQQVFMCKV